MAAEKIRESLVEKDNLYGIDSDFLTIPHPKISERNFVLVPLSEISPDFKIGGKNIKKYIDEGNFTEKVDLMKNW